LGLRPDPAGVAYSAPPDPLAGFKGPISKEREGRKDGMEGQWGELRAGNLLLSRGGRGEERGGSCFLTVRGMDAPDHSTK